MWYKVNTLRSNGLNKSQISLELGIDRATVRRYLKMNESEFHAWIQQKRPGSQKLSVYKQFVLDQLQSAYYLSSAQIEDRLKEHFVDFPKVNSKTVYNFVKKVRQEYGLPKAPKKAPRLYQKLPDPPFGEEAQVDFGEHHMQTEGSGRVKVYFFVLTLSRSRYKYVYFQVRPFISKTASYAHELAFSYIQGIPSNIIYDQDRVFIVQENLGDVLLTEEFRQLSEKYSFNAVFCRKADPESKGKVESVVKYVKNNFLKGRKFTSLEHLQEAVLGWLSRTANTKPHGTTRIPPVELWKEEQPYLLPFTTFPEQPLFKLLAYKVRKDNTLAYRGNFYSLPLGTYQDTGSEVLLEEKNGVLLLYDKNQQLMAQHIIPAEKGKYISNTDHKRTKSKTLQKAHELLVDELGQKDQGREYLEKLEKDKPRYYYDNVRVIRKGIQGANAPVLHKTVLFCLENKLYNGYSFIEVLGHYQKEEKAQTISSNIQIEGASGLKSLSGLSPATSDIDIYENILLQSCNK